MIFTTVESKGGTQSSEDWNFWYGLQNKKVDIFALFTKQICFVLFTKQKGRFVYCKYIQWSILYKIDLLKYSTLRVF